MYDCFNMAYQDNVNPLQLHIKINSENLLPASQKYNAGSLRIPADPSWPKIPQRKLIDDNDAIEQPCIVTLTGTPRRSRTIVHTPLNQSPKSIITRDSAYSSLHHQKTASSMYTLKRVPGYADPRFKRVTNANRSQFTSNESFQKVENQSDTTTCMKHLHRKELEKPMLDKDIIMTQTIKQEAERPCNEQKIKPTQNHEDNDKFRDSKADTVLYNTNKNESTEGDKYFKNDSHPECTPKTSINDANTQADSASICPLAVQENNGQLFFMLDQKTQSHPINAIHVDKITVPQDCIKQCYNVQLPVFTYQNIPMQISASGTNNKDHRCLNHSICMNGCNTSSLIKTHSRHVEPDQTQDINKSVASDAKDENNSTKEGSDSLRVQENMSGESKKISFMSDSPEKENGKDEKEEKLQGINIQQNHEESSDSEYYIPNTNKKNLYNSTLQRLKMKKKLPYHTSGAETTDSEFITQKNVSRKEFIDTLYRDQGTPLSEGKENHQLIPQSKALASNEHHYQNYQTPMCETKMKNKSEQNLTCAKSECTQKLCRSSEPHITFKQKKASAKFSRKAKSYFQKNSHSALVDSDYTLVWPNCQYTNYKRGPMYNHKFSNIKVKKINQHLHSAAIHKPNVNAPIDNTTHFVEQSCLQNNNTHVDPKLEVIKCLSKQCVQGEHCKSDLSPRSNTDDMFGEPKVIPTKTQELLNKSYWEYYNKLKHKMKNVSGTEKQNLYHFPIDALERGKKGKACEKVYDKELRHQLNVNPEIQTLQQCTTLSTMINKALDSNLQPDVDQSKDLYLNGNVKSPSNGAVGLQSTKTQMIPCLAKDETAFVKNVKCKKGRTNDKQLLELKSVIFFSGMMYILIIFLPMLYDYFYYEEYETYENLTYAELIVDYVLSSFKEAFGGVFDGAKKILFYPHACQKCNNIA